MGTSVTKNISEINISQPTFTLTITNNNTGNSITVQQQPNPTLSIQTPGPQGGRGLQGPKGDKGLPGSLESADGLIVTGSVLVSGSGTVDFLLSEGGVTGSFSGDGSGLTGVISASYAVTASHAITALTASFALNAGGGTGVGFPFSGSAVITGSLVISGSGDLTTTGIISASKVKSVTGSFARLEGFSPIRVGDQITFEQVSSFTSITASAGISASGNIIAPNLIQDSSSFSARITANEFVVAKTLISGSGQIASDISGSFTSISASLSDRVRSNELITSRTLISGSSQIASDISGSSTALSSSIATRIANIESGATLKSGILSGSAQIASQISGSFTNVSESISSRLTINKTNITDLTANTSSYVLNAQTSSMTVFFATSASYAVSSSVEILKEISSSHANRADFADGLRGQPSIDVTAITASGDLIVPQYIKHKGDVNTLINFTDNRIRFKAGDIGFFDIEKDASAPYPATINPGGNRINFRVVDRNTNLLLKTDSEKFKVNLYYAGNQKLETAVDGVNITGSLNISGSITGDGSGLTNIPSTGIVGLDLDKITSGTATASISETDGFKVNVNSQITGSGGTEKYALKVSQSINAYNVNVGNPTSNAWQTNLEGSFFNNFTTQTDTSEILRFVAGILSASAPNPLPNTNIWNSATANYTLGSTISKNSLFVGSFGSTTYESSAKLSKSWQTSTYINLDLTQSIVDVQKYLISKGFLLSSETASSGETDQTGTNPFNNNYGSNIPSTITRTNQFGNFTFNIDANAAGSSTVKNNANYFGLGALSSGGPNPYTVLIRTTHSFSDTETDDTPDEDSKFSTSSIITYTQNSFGTSGDGLILEKLETAQPTVIPAAFQDGDFNGVDSPISGRKYTGGATAAANISASGYYRIHGVEVGLKSGSQSEFTIKTPNTAATQFYLYTGDLPSNITTGAPNASISNTNLTRTSFSFTSESLSGAPFITATSYGFTFSGQVANSFNPIYGYNSTPLQITQNNGWNSIGSPNLSNDSVSVTSAGVQTVSATRGVLSSDKSVQRTSGNIPFINDIVFCTASFSFSLNSSGGNISEARSIPTYNLNFTLTGRNWQNSSQGSTTSNQPYYDSSLFGTPVASGSMGILGSGLASSTNTVEYFHDETRRKVIGTSTTLTNAWDSDTLLNLSDSGDLQVKPGYLVDPESANGYWYPADNYNSGHYKWYLREFTTTATNNKGSITIDLSPNSSADLVDFSSTTTNKIAIGIIFEAQLPANSGDSRTRIFDAVKGNASYGGSLDNQSTSAQLNPFSDNIDILGDFGSFSNSNGTLTLGLNNPVNQTVNGTFKKVYLLIRYKGTPSQTLEQINISVS